MNRVIIAPSRSGQRRRRGPGRHRLAWALLAAGLLSACSGAGEDVRIRLCKDLVQGQLGTAATPSWTEVSTQTPGYEDAVVRLRWSGAEGEGRARCYYPYDAVDDTAQQLAAPLSAYSTSPSEVVINGRSLSGQALARALGKAMQRQGKDLLDSAGKLLQD